MLNRKLTEADIGKTFELYGVPDGHYMERVTLHAIEGDRCYFRCEDMHPVETNLIGNTFPGDFVPCTISEIEEPFYVGKGTQDLTTIPRSLPPLDKETEALLNEL